MNDDEEWRFKRILEAYRVPSEVVDAIRSLIDEVAHRSDQEGWDRAVKFSERVQVP